MVTLNRIYTRTGDAGETSLGNGERRAKFDLRVQSFGTIDEANSAIGMARLHTREANPALDEMLARIQNDLFDLGADLCTPEKADAPVAHALRIIASQVERLEREIDQINAHLQPLKSFVLPGGTPASAALHLARTIVRRAERLMVELDLEPGESVGKPALHYVNRLSDFLFVASRCANNNGGDDVLWKPGLTR